MAETVHLSVEEWMAEMQALATAQEHGGAMTLRELCAASGISYTEGGSKRMRQLLRQAMDAGRLEVRRVARVTITGANQMVPAYVVLPAQTSPKKKRKS